MLNVAGFYDRLLAFIRQVDAEGFISPEDHDLIVVADNPEELVERLLARVAARPPQVPGAPVADVI